MSIRFVDSPIDTASSQLKRYRLDQPAQALIERIVKDVAGQYEIEPGITVFGKKCNQPRNIQFRSDVSKGYFYSGQVARAKPMTPDITALLALVNETAGAEYNAILINQYENGSKNVGAHSDSKEALDDTAGVFAISYGATRNFRIRDKQGKQIVKNVPAKHAEALQMAGNFQNEYTHEIPKEMNVHAPRVSFTFRKHDPVAEAKMWVAHERASERRTKRARLDPK